MTIVDPGAGQPSGVPAHPVGNAPPPIAPSASATPADASPMALPH